MQYIQSHVTVKIVDVPNVGNLKKPSKICKEAQMRRFAENMA